MIRNDGGRIAPYVQNSRPCSASPCVSAKRISRCEKICIQVVAAICPERGGRRFLFATIETRERYQITTPVRNVASSMA